MELEEFVRLDPSEIRRSNELMQLFVEFYEAAFSLKINCSGCTFKKGFRRLKNYAEKGSNIKKSITMKNFKLKSYANVQIHSYKKNGKIYRSYGYNMTEEFAKELVAQGKTDIFAELPKVEDKKSSLYDLDWREEVLPKYNELKEKTGLKAESNKKDDIIAFIEKYES